MNELRSQFVCEQLRTRMDGIEVYTDLSGLRENQDDLSSRIGRFEESVNLHGLHHVNESLHRIIRLEASVGHGHVSASLRECHVRANQCTDNLARLEDRIRAQDGYHDLSEQESSDAIRRMLDGRQRPTAQRRAARNRIFMQARVPLGELDQWVNQLRNDVQNCGLDNEAIHQRITRLLAEHQRREANGRSAIEQRIVQLDMNSRMQ